MSQKDYNFKFALLEEYFGDARQVIKQIQECRVCQTEMIFSHQSDYKSFLLEESSQCPECGHKNTNLVFRIN